MLTVRMMKPVLSDATVLAPMRLRVAVPLRRGSVWKPHDRDRARFGQEHRLRAGRAACAGDVERCLRFPSTPQRCCRWTGKSRNLRLASSAKLITRAPRSSGAFSHLRFRHLRRTIASSNLGVDIGLDLGFYPADRLLTELHRFWELTARHFGVDRGARFARPILHRRAPQNALGHIG